MPFILKNNSVDYSFETDGSATSGGTPAGTWSVNDANQIVLTPKAGAALTFPVDWSFVENQLWLLSGGQKLFNFHAAGMPDYNVVNNRLQVIPRATGFAFTLTCVFGLNNDLDLTLKIGATTSAINGALEDTQAQFIYRFTDDTLGLTDALILSGQWDRDTSADGELRMKFTYVVNGQSQSIAIPRAFDVNPFTNSLRLRYEKDGQTRLLELAGEIQFSNNHTIVFTIKKSASAGTSTLQVGVQLTGTGQTLKSLELTLLKQDGSAGRSISVGGKLSFNVGTGGLSINFLYSKSAGGPAQPMLSLAVNGTFTTAGATIVFSYKKDDTGQTFSVVAKDVRVGDVGNLSAAFQIVQNGQQRAVRAFLAFAW